jgi:hypothetical protein
LDISCQPTSAKVSLKKVSLIKVKMAVHNLCNRTVEVVDCDVHDEERGNRQTYDSVVPHQEMQECAGLGDSDSCQQ